jgi:hypothetical protein
MFYNIGPRDNKSVEQTINVNACTKKSSNSGFLQDMADTPGACIIILITAVIYGFP